MGFQVLQLQPAQMIAAIGAQDLPIDSVAGLPLHPLVVHAAVVLVPLAAAGLLAMTIWPRFSRRFSPLILVIAGLGVLAAFAAMLSGEQLADEIGMRNQQHFEFGEQVPWVALAQFVFAGGLAWWDRQRSQRGVFGIILAIVCALVAIGAVVGSILAGHSGAELVWG
ncbi:MAG: hypothetical protein K0U64_10200 [Actinomycetia bacterium]|nr:hypothetical protein [Actinomycetes bacterium]